ncbi:MAG: hypothetical protein ACI9EF_002796 [Pseudohongiellaceae bacterium]|jgi:hypothetical protein
MIAHTSLVAATALALAACGPAADPGDDPAPTKFAEELPGYDEFYKRSGALVRLDDEIARDRSIDADGE